MTSSVRVPDSLAATLAPDTLRALEDALAPPPALRAKARIEIEIEAAGEGTFTLVVEGAQPMTAKKGFAKDPFLSIQIGKGGWPLIQRELQMLVDGLPGAPELRRHVDALRAPRPGELDALVQSARKIEDACVRFDVKNANGGASATYNVARGPVDEATRVLQVGLDGAVVEQVLAGQAPPTAVQARIGGDRSVLTSAAAALAPLLERLR